MTKPRQKTICWCGIPYTEHARCAGCGILVGLEHITKTVERFLDETYCADCLQVRKKLQCSSCGAHQMWYDHEIVHLVSRNKDTDTDYVGIIIEGICRSCGTSNKFTK